MNQTQTLKRPILWAVFGVLGFILLLRFLFCIHSIGVGQVGIVTSYGNVKGEISSGLHFIPPWEGVVTMNVQVQNSTVTADAQTLDLQNVTTTETLNFNLTPATAFDIYQKVGPTYVANIVDPAMQETFKAVTAKYNATDLVQERQKVQADTLAALDAAFSNKGIKGITVDNLNVIGFQFSPQFAGAVESKQVAEQQVQTEQYNLQATQIKAQANQVQTSSLTPQILEQQAINKWDGKLPRTYSSGGASSSIFGILVNPQS